MAKFTASVPLNIKWNGLDIAGAVGATHRIPDAYVDEFMADPGRQIPGLTWITQDETSGIPVLPLAQSDVTNLVDDLAAKFNRSGGTISGAVTITGALAGSSTITAAGAITGASVSAVGAVQAASVISPAVTATALRLKGAPWYDVKAYGATGDGTTDDLAAFNAIVTAIGTSGSGVIFVPKGTYRLSDSWNIDCQNVHVELDPGAVLFTATTTSLGHTVGFIGALGSGTATSPTRGWASIRGGTVTNSGNGTLDNAIGFVRYDNARCEGVRIPSCGRKAITAQYGVTNVYIVNNVIGTTGNAGITVESTCTNVHIRGNRISSAGAEGINATGAITDIRVSDNVVEDAVGATISVSTAAQAWIENNTVRSSGSAGIFASTITQLHVAGNAIYSPTTHGLDIRTVSDRCHIIANYISNASAGTTGAADVVALTSLTCRPSIIGNSVAGTTHRFVENANTMSGNQAVSVGNIWLAGSSAVYGNWTPLTIEDLVDGIRTTAAASTGGTATALHVVQGTAAPSTGTWLRGDICWNTSPSASGTPGWVCVTAGTPGTWKAMANLAA